MVSTGTIEKTVTSNKKQHAPRYRVLLHNDDFNSMEHVVESLVKTVPSLSVPQAVDIMMQAHNSGVGLSREGGPLQEADAPRQHLHGALS